MVMIADQGDTYFFCSWPCSFLNHCIYSRLLEPDVINLDPQPLDFPLSGRQLKIFGPFLIGCGFEFCSCLISDLWMNRILFYGFLEVNQQGWGICRRAPLCHFRYRGTTLAFTSGHIWCSEQGFWARHSLSLHLISRTAGVKEPDVFSVTCPTLWMC